MKQIKGGITVVPGFEAAAAAAQIKYEGRTDMALIYSSVPCVAAGTFTTNVVKAAPVKWDQKIVKQGGAVQAIIVFTILHPFFSGTRICQFGNCKCVYRRRRDAIL